MLLLSIKVKEATFAVVLMTADAQLGKRDSVFCDNLYSLLVSLPPKIKRKSSKITLKIVLRSQQPGLE